MIYEYNEDVDFYAAPNLLGSNQTTGGSFQVNLATNTTYYVLLKVRGGLPTSNTTTITGPGNISFNLSSLPIPTLTE